MRSLLFVFFLVSPLCFSQEAIEEVLPSYPSYPESPVCRDDAGDITLSFYILETGTPHKIEIVNTDSIRFSRSAIKTLAKYRFKANTYSIGSKYFKTFNFTPEYKCGKNS